MIFAVKVQRPNKFKFSIRFLLCFGLHHLIREIQYMAPKMLNALLQ